MKNCLVVLLSLVTAFSYAQDTTGKKYALGLFGETNGMFSGNNVAGLSTGGVQYTKRSKKYFGYKLMLGTGIYREHPQATITSIITDTVYKQRIATHARLGIIGGGINWERRFYGKLHFFAGLDLRIGYGTGNEDTTFITESYVNNALMVPGIATTAVSATGPGADMFYAGFTPSFGLELKWKRLNIGTEFMNYVTYTSVNVHGHGTTGNMDYDAANITQRIFIQYRF